MKIFVFQTCTDVFAGQFQLMGEMSKQYLNVEPRYLLGPIVVDGQGVFWTSMCELFFQSPLCLLCFYGYHTRAAWRRPAEIIVSVLHIAGVWWFYVPEGLQTENRGKSHAIRSHCLRAHARYLA